MPALLGVVLAALLIHFLFYLVPGLLGMKTGLPLYVVGTSTYGVQGGLILPGLFMGVLQFFWLGFNAFFIATVLCQCFEIGLNAKGEVAIPGLTHGVIAVVWTVAGALVGLKGIQYVAKIATPFPLIPIAVLLILTASTIGGLGGFTPEKTYQAAPAAAAVAEAPSGETAETATTQTNKLQPLGAGAAILATIACIVGFFATAGAAGVDISMNSTDAKNVQKGGLVGIALATVFSAGLSLIIVAGYYGSTANVPADLAGKLDPIVLMKGGILSAGFAKVLMILLAISSFPAACFSSFIAANSFKTVLPKVNPFLSVGVGAAGSCILAATGWAGNAAGVFGLIGASFGPVCGAMVADYLLAGKKWAGPRAGFNMAGWISWLLGFVVGAPDLFALIPGLDFLRGSIPCPPMAAFIVGFVLYFVLAKVGLQSKQLEMPAAK
jgi:cytosine permease